MVVDILRIPCIWGPGFGGLSRNFPQLATLLEEVSIAEDEESHGKRAVKNTKRLVAYRVYLGQWNDNGFQETLGKWINMKKSHIETYKTSGCLGYMGDEIKY